MPFRRTPRYWHRTRTPAAYIAVLYVITAYCTATAAIDGMTGHWLTGAFAINASIFMYAIGRFIGWRESVKDLGAPACEAIMSMRRWLFSRQDIARGLAPIDVSTSNT